MYVIAAFANVLFGVAVMGGVSTLAQAQSWPTKPVRLVIAVAAGGNLDILTRGLAQKLSESFGHQVIVENRPGINSILGTESVARAAPDGYTFLMMASTFVIVPSVAKNVPYDPVRDFTGVTLLGWLPQLLVAHPSLPARSVKDLIAFARARPGELNYGSSGHGAFNELAMELFNRQAGIRTTAIPYKGNSLSLIDTVGGQVSLTMNAIGPALPYVQSGRLRALGVSSPKRSALLPDVPAIAETLPGYEASLFNAMVAPVATPKDIVARMHGEVVKAMQTPDLRNRAAQQGVEVSTSSTPEQFTAFVKADYAKWAKVVREAGMRPE